MAKVFTNTFAALGFALLATGADAALTVTPITWNVIGLDSNSPASGPNRFPVGARVCSNAATAGVSVVWSWDSANANINLRPGSLASITIPSIAAGACADGYFEVEVTQVPAAFDTARSYHITATDGSGSATSPTPRQLYVEHLISQNRNSTTGVKLNGVSIPAGGSMTLVVGNTYTIELDGATATQGYEQLEEFINFSNTIFQILAVNTTYSSNTSIYVMSPNDKLYADACLWENDPNSPNYRSCVGVAGKSGGTVITTYTVKIISGGGTSQALSNLIYDFSGSSFHYNSDFAVGARIATIVDPSLVTMSKKFTPNPTTVGGVSTLTFTLTNPNSGPVGSLSFADALPTSPGAMVVATPPAASTSGCGAATFAPVAGASSISFSNGTVAGSSTCTIRVNVAVPAAGTYSNTSGHLFIGAVDTGNSASDSLTVTATPPPPPLVCGITLANWSVPNGTVANPPDLAGGVPTVKAANVASAASSANLPASTAILASSGHGDTTSWQTYGYKDAGQFIQFAIDTSKYTAVQMSFWVANPSPANGPTSIALTVNSGSGFGAAVLTVANPAAAFTIHTVDLTGLTSTTGTTTFRLTATGANNNATGASLNYDDIGFIGCGTPLPPTLSKAFAPNPVAVGAASTLTFSITNPNGSIPLTGVAFSDSLPTGLTAPNGTTAVCGGSLVVTGGNLLTFTAGTLAAGASCAIPVAVTATTAGPHPNVSGFVSSTEGGTNSGATGTGAASLTALLPPVIAKQFAPNPILALGVSTLTFVITNPNQSDALSSVAFSDTFPTSPGAMVVAAAPAASVSGCGAPTFAPGAGAASVSFSGGTIAGGATCTVTVNITAPAVGTYNNTSGNISHVINAVTVNGNTATGSLTVKAPQPTIGALKQVGLTNNPLGTWTSFLAVAAGTNVFYKITIENDGDVALSPVGASDPNVSLAGCVWPGSLPVAVSGNDNHIATCVVGPVAAVSGLNPNTATVSGTGGGSTVTHASTASYATTGLSIVKSAAQSFFVSAGDLINYSYLVTNTGFAPLQGPVTVSDTKVAVTCPAVSTVGDLDNFLDPSEALTCTATYTVTPADVAAQSVTNNAFATVAGVNSSTVSKTVSLLTPPTIAKSFAAPMIPVGGTVNMSFVLTNPGGTALSGIAFTDTLPAGLTTPNASTATCGGTLVASSNVLTFTGGTLAANANCTINVTVTGATVGVKNNTTGAISSTQTGAGATSNTATVTVVAPPTITKSFAAPTVALGGTVNMSFVLTNPAASAITGLSFTDTLPAGLTIPNASIATCGGNLVTSSNVLTFTAGTLGAGANCTITVTVTGATAGVKNNTTGAISSNETGSGAPSNTATVTVLAPPTIAKSFAAPTVALGGTVNMSFVLTNPAATPITGLTFSDTLPAGLTAPNASTATCGGTLVTSSNVLTFTGGTLAGGAGCTITVTVTGATVGVKNNTTGAISSNETGTGAASNTATVTVLAPPTIAKSFAAPTVAIGGTVNMSFVLTNPAATPITGLAFSDTLPAGLTTPNASTATCGGTLVASSNALTFTGGTLAGGANCTINVTVTGATAGVKNNTTGVVSSNETGSGATSNTATVTVLAPPTIAKSFATPTVALGGTVNMSFVLTNPAATPITGVTFSDTLPPGLTTPNASTATCGGTLVASSNVLTFTGGTLAGGANCTINVTVTGATVGVKNNTTGAISSTETGTGAASNTATVTVIAPPTITKSFAAPTVALGGTVNMSFVLTNPSATVALTGLAFTDALPAGLTTPNASTAACGGGTLVASGNVLTFTGGTLAASANCTITVAVTGATAGIKNNTTGTISSTQTGAGATSNTATLTVIAMPTITKSFAAPTVALGGSVNMSFVLTNPNATVALTGLAFTDTLPAGLTTPNASTATCGGTLVASSNVLTFTGGALATSASCTITVAVTGATAGVKNNTTGAISSTETGAGAASNTATLTVVAPPTIAKSFAAPTVGLGGTVGMSFVLINPNATVALTGLSFSDTLPAGLTAPNASTATCGGTLVTSSNVLTFTGGTLATSASCTITVTVTGATLGVKNNTTGPIGSTESGPGAASNTATVTVGASPTIAKSFAAPTVALGGTVNMSFVLTNPGATPLTGVAFTDTLPAGLTAPNASTATCGGTLVISSNVLTFTGGTLAANANCTITVTVTGATVGVKNNTTGPLSSNETGTGAPSNTATVTVGASPTIAKSFAAPTVGLGGTVNMSFVLTNPNATVALTGVAFTDTLPAGLTAPNASTAICGGTLVTSSNVLTFTGGTLATSASCTITVTVTGGTVGVKNNTTGPISSTETGTGTPSNTATVTVGALPTIAKSFAAPTIAVSGTVGMSFVLTNPAATAVTGLAFADTLPAGLTTPNASTTTCGGTLVASSNVLTLTGGTLGAGANCTITLTVTGATLGVKNNTTGPISSNETGTGAPSNTATVTVLGPPTIVKSFGAPSIPINGTTALSLTLTNPNPTVALTGLGFTDVLPSGLTVPNGSVATCGGTLVTNSNVLTFSGGTLAGGASCTMTVTVSGVGMGQQNNTTSSVTASGPVILTGTASNTATVTIGEAPAPVVIPVLGPWTLLLLGLLVAWSGARRARR
ncbi:MAG: hypothetical protein ABI981_05805 [Betaproteobacteria bacterium]